MEVPSLHWRWRSPCEIALAGVQTAGVTKNQGQGRKIGRSELRARTTDGAACGSTFAKNLTLRTRRCAVRVEHEVSTSTRSG